MPSRVVIVLLALAVVMLGGLFYLLSVHQSGGPATLPEIGPGAKRVSGSAVIGAPSGAKPDGDVRP